MVQLGFKAVHFFVVALYANRIAPSGYPQFGVFALNEFEFVVGCTKKLQMIDIRQNDFFFVQRVNNI
jgi:hypothetical protein